MKRCIEISDTLLNKFIKEVKLKYPLKSFGYFLSSEVNGDPIDFILFSEDDRKKESNKFKSFGKYYETHSDAGFISTTEETWKVEKMLMEKGLYKVGVYHSHRRQPAIFSSVDKQLHPTESLWHLIIALRNLDDPQIKIFAINNGKVEEACVEILGVEENIEKRINQWNKSNKDNIDINSLYSDLKEILVLDKNGEHIIKNNKIIYKALCLSRLLPPKMQNDLIYDRYIKDVNERRENFIQNNMIMLCSDKFYMGQDVNDKYTYIGESPKHEVDISSFYISKSVITQGQYKKFDSHYIVKKTSLPAVNVSWYDAYLFSKWIGMRLPTESEWEYACHRKSEDLWCCSTEEELKNYGWYSESGVKTIQEVMQLTPNKFGIYDMHGNVWEWCQDNYSESYSEDINNFSINSNSNEKVCKGGSVYAFAEMCRNSFRYGELASFFAHDLGFRVATDR